MLQVKQQEVQPPSCRKSYEGYYREKHINCDTIKSKKKVYFKLENTRMLPECYMWGNLNIKNMPLTLEVYTKQYKILDNTVFGLPLGGRNDNYFCLFPK